MTVCRRMGMYVCVCMCLKVVDIMRVNVDKVLERDQKLSELDNRAGNCTTAVSFAVWLAAC